MSRSNVSTSLRELITWGVVKRVHIIGDRRDRFEALKDVMETFRVIMAERKRREMDPTIALLEHCVREAKAGDESERVHARATGEDARVHPDGDGLVQPDRPPLDARRSSGSSGAGRRLAKLFGRGGRAAPKPEGEREKAEAGVTST